MNILNERKTDMFNPSTNPQVKYSLREMASALFRLMNNDHFNDITITMICNEADISRKTFYRNCQNKLDLVHYACFFCLEKLYETVDWNFVDVTEAYRNFFRFWSENSIFLHIIWKNGLFHEFTSVFIMLSDERTSYSFLNDYIKDKPNANEIKKYHHAFIVGGLCSILEHWTAEGFKTSIDDLVNLCLSFAPIPK